MKTLAAQTSLILRNDLRLFWRDLRSGKLQLLGNGLFLGFAFLVGHLFAIILCVRLGTPPAAAVETVIWAFFGFTMLGAAMSRAIGLLYERADFDLLLASPVRPHAVLLARLASVGVGAAAGVALFTLPLIHGAAIGFSPVYLTGYVVWALLAALTGAGGVALTLALVRWLGVRRARVIAQIVAALLGASVYLCTQLPRLLPRARRDQTFAGLGELAGYPPLSWLGQAGRGDPLALGALALLAAAVVALTARHMARVFVRGTQDATIVTTRRADKARPHRWTGGLGPATFRKDLRLIVRDPLLFAQILPSVVYFVPMLLGSGRALGVGILAPAAVVVAAQFSQLLSTVAVDGEEGWDLILVSPTPELRLRLAKMAAGMALPLALAALLCLGLAVAGRPWIALLGFVAGAVNAAACSWLAVCRIRPSPRRDVLKKRTGGTSAGHVGRGLFSAGLMLAAAGAVGLVAAGHGRYGAILLGLDALLVAACFSLVRLRSADLDTLAKN